GASRNRNKRYTWLAGCDHNDQRETIASAGSEVRRRDQRRRSPIEGMVAAARRAAQASAEYSPYHDRRLRLRRAEHFWRRHPDASIGSDWKNRAALHANAFDRLVLTDTRGSHHGTQPPLDGLRGGLGAVHRFPWLQQYHSQR